MYQTTTVFPTVKLLNYRQQWSGLEESRNPFATVVMAHLKAQETRHDPVERQTWKLQLTRRLYKLGYDRQRVLDLFRFIDWVLQLPGRPCWISPWMPRRWTRWLRPWMRCWPAPAALPIETAICQRQPPGAGRTALPSGAIHAIDVQIMFVLKIALWPVSDRASHVFMGRGACPA